jgi:hypothetical protein
MSIKITEDFHEKIHKDLFRQDLCTIIHEISSCNVRLHRLVLSGDYLYSKCIKALGKLKIDNTFVRKERCPYYQTKSIKQYKDFYLNIFAFPVAPIYPLCFIEVHPKTDLPVQTYKKFLKELDSDMPYLKVSSVEYAIDLFCNNPEQTGSLYWLIRRCLYLTHQREAKTLDSTQIEKHGKTIERNEVYRVGGKFKVYVRGHDLIKKDGGWNLENINRVRMEHTAKRTLLRENGIELLPDLIKDSRFLDVNKGKWQFKKFEGSKKLPKFWQQYSTQDDNGFAGSYQAEHIKAPKTMRQYSKGIDEMTPFVKKLEEAMSGFDNEWESVPL